jgi:alcohol dehydrogenase (cytochrome c)
MSAQQRTILATFSAGVLALAVVAQAQTSEGGGDYPGRDWPLVGGDWSGSRYTTLRDITTDTVSRLNGAWVAQLDGGAASRATPVVQAGVLYLTGGANVFAIDARTGDTVWRWQTPATNEQRVPSWQGGGLSDEFVFAPRHR